jgi:nucleoside phosphorylase
MRVLVTFAVDAEFAPWRKRHGFERREVTVPNHQGRADIVYSAKIGSSNVDVYLTGIGLPSHGPGLYSLLSGKPHILISSGLAGGLNGSLKTGDIVVARSLALVEGGDKINSKRNLVELAEQCQARAVDLFLTSRRIVSQAQYKKSMANFGDVVEMESYHVLSRASGTQVASIAIRAISDTQEEDLPLDFEKAIEPWGRVNARQLVLQIVRYPQRIPSLIRFGRNCERATEKLADFLDTYLEAVADASPQWFDGPAERMAAV